MKAFTLPDLGEGLAESEIIEWHVNIGDVVTIDQVILTVETAKATVDVPAPYSGTIVSRHGQAGDIINIGSLLVEIDEQVTATSESNTASLNTTTLKTMPQVTASQSVSNAEVQSTSSKNNKNDAATVVGNVSQQSHNINIDEFWIGSDNHSNESNTDKPLITALPSARVLAQKMGINLANIQGSGPDGVILDGDVYQACDKQRPGTEMLKGARRSMAASMAKAHQQIAAVTITEEAILSRWSTNEDITTRLVQAIVAACQHEPALNAWFDPDTMTRCVHDRVNIGIAVDSQYGLYVPVLRHADEFNASGIRKWVDDTVAGIKARKIGREQLQHGTITLSNFGAIAGIYATPVVSPPQVAIVGAGRIIKKIRLNQDASIQQTNIQQATEVDVLPLSMTFDHRACTGGEAARFMKALVNHLEG
ncbi:branched-chain alpha-keto acid dehydrogenase subunit E2 [Photobacterium jeanii]|uniref:Dihydrolipoamide acetyltransferase component of pyruvate dehydrogenase complex n=1 Tax=Photobacterium jeanii TaxID=858640 RepID=A0A178K8W5_9GAMM|nr:dihydrolipoamide acetyltransferase family protein [Photobacterium jeanii]OAN13132.1 branched-chain alpha-keto acid dehydrogenase subunit E2 [Photobacterium jeanii]PST89284.1 2-oxo acid dehydrogenase subunit E2 [Photobacterium jeanii]